MSDTFADIFGDAEIISRYTRAQAIEDGVLVDVSETAREAGFTVPVALTIGLWGLIDPTQAECDLGQSAEGRLWDVLFMAHTAIKNAEGGDLLFYEVLLQMRRGDRSWGMHKRRLKLHSGPGDEGEHVITIMLPEED